MKRAVLAVLITVLLAELLGRLVGPIWALPGWARLIVLITGAAGWWWMGYNSGRRVERDLWTRYPRIMRDNNRDPEPKP
jgi:hypothetical protein